MIIQRQVDQLHSVTGRTVTPRATGFTIWDDEVHVNWHSDGSQTASAVAEENKVRSYYSAIYVTKCHEETMSHDDLGKTRMCRCVHIP